MPKEKMGPPKSLSNESQAQLRASEQRLADLKSGRAGHTPPKKAKPPLPRNIFGADQALRDAARR